MPTGCGTAALDAAREMALPENRMLVIRDREPFISAKLARHYFERAVRENPALTTPLDCTVDAGGLVEYADPKTHAMWVGWALGMRCTERIIAAMPTTQAPTPPAPDTAIQEMRT